MTAHIRFGNPYRLVRSRPPQPRLGEMRPLAMAALADASGALAAAGVRHWLSYGALLGMVREGQLLGHDGDIDLLVADRPDPAAVKAALAAAGFSYRGGSEIGGRVTTQGFARGPVLFDVFFAEREGAVYVDRAPFDNHSVCEGTHLAMALTPLDCGGFSVPAPADREAYLSHLYGPGWKTPNTGWDWRLSPPNVTIRLSWRSLPRLLALKLRHWWRLRAAA